MLAIIIPYRASTQPERRDQLKNLLDAFAKFIPSAYVYIMEQHDDKPFNRGALLNVGIKVAGMGDNDVICFHDVDLLPCENLIQEYLIPLDRGTVRHIARVWKRYDSDTYLGGILLMNQGDFIAINGFPNNFWGWGGEDDELRDRIQRHGLTIQRSEHGKLIDQEHMTLSQKLSHLKRTQQKCPNKWEMRQWNKEHPNQDGYKQVQDSIFYHHMYSKQCFHYWVSF